MALYFSAHRINWPLLALALRPALLDEFGDGVADGTAGGLIALGMSFDGALYCDRREAVLDVQLRRYGFYEIGAAGH